MMLLHRYHISSFHFPEVKILSLMSGQIWTHYTSYKKIRFGGRKLLRKMEKELATTVMVTPLAPKDSGCRLLLARNIVHEVSSGK